MGTQAAMIAIFRRAGGMPPGDNELLEVYDDGAFRMRRVYGTHRAGRFAGHLDEQDLLRVRAEADACAGAGDYRDPGPITPDSSTEIVELQGASAAVSPYDEPPPPWQGLVSELRRLSDDLTSQPEAAVELRLEPERVSAQLQHLGQRSLDLVLDRVEVEAYLVGPSGETLGSWAEALPAPPQDVAAGIGWRYDLGVEASGFELGPGRYYQVSATFGFVDDGGITYRARLSTSNA